MPSVKQIARIASDDPALNRLQDQLSAALNPLLRGVQGDLSGPLESPTVGGLQGIAVATTRPATGQVLAFDGAKWAPAAGGGGSGTVTSVNASGGSTGLTFSGGPITTSGTLTLGGTLTAGSGGTGLASPGTVGNVLTSTGTGWVSSPAPGGAPTGAAGGVLGYTGSTYPDPSGLAASVFTVPGEGFIRLRYGADTLGNLVTTFLQMDATATTSTNANRSVGLRAGTATGGQFGVNIVGGDLTLKGGTGSSAVSGGGGGTAYLLGGDGGTGNWDGGSAIVQGGYGSSGGGVGGTAELNGGFGASGAARGGNTYVRGGSAPGGVPGGHVFVLGGSNQFQNTTGGSVTIRGGQGITNGTVHVGDSVTTAVRLGAASVKTHLEGPTTLTPKATTTIDAAGDDLDATTTYVPFDVTGGNYTLTSTPTVLTAGAVAGQVVVLRNVGAANYVELQRGATYALRLSAATRKIDVGGSITLLFDGTYWTEIAHVETTTI